MIPFILRDGTRAMLADKLIASLSRELQICYDPADANYMIQAMVDAMTDAMTNDMPASRRDVVGVPLIDAMTDAMAVAMTGAVTETMADTLTGSTQWPTRCSPP